MKVKHMIAAFSAFAVMWSSSGGLPFDTLTANAEPTDDNVTEYGYTGEVQTFTAPADGYYKLEAWGAQGGNTAKSHSGGYGGYSTGTVCLTEGTELSVYVGGKGGADAGGWNGGGAGCVGPNAKYSSYYQQQHGRSGGGATDFRISGDTLYHRILVAGGGGGAVQFGRGWANGKWSYQGFGGGAGGGETGGNGGAGTGSGGSGGTQTDGGSGGTGSLTAGNDGAFGIGADSPGTTSDAPGAGGGGGWYGGGSGGSGAAGAASNKASAGGGGSGFAFTGGTPVEDYMVDEKYALTSVSLSNGENQGNGKASVTRLHWDVSFDGNGGTVTRDTDVVYVTGMSDASTYTADYTIPDETADDAGAEWDGHVFMGWNTKADGTGEYANEDIVLTEDTTLYAQWNDAPSFTVTIPAEVTLGDGKYYEVRVEQSSLSEDHVKVYIHGDENGLFKVTQGDDELTYTISGMKKPYYYADPEDETSLDVVDDQEIITREGGEDTGNPDYIRLMFNEPEEVPKYSGRYEGIVTFDIKVN